MTNILNDEIAKGLHSRLISFVDGKMSMYLKPGTYEAKLFSVNGQEMAKTVGTSKGGIMRTTMNVDKLGNGFYVLTVKHPYGVLSKRVMLSR